MPLPARGFIQVYQPVRTHIRLKILKNVFIRSRSLLLIQYCLTQMLLLPMLVVDQQEMCQVKLTLLLQVVVYLILHIHYMTTLTM